jgi:hypothetical protein
MAVEAEDVVKKLIMQMACVHFTPEQATRLKKFIDSNTDTRGECPCSKCRKSYSMLYQPYATPELVKVIIRVAPAHYRPQGSPK